MDKFIGTADLPWRASATLDGGGGFSVTLRGIAKLPSAALPPPAANDRPCVRGAGLGLPVDTDTSALLFGPLFLVRAMGAAGKTLAATAGVWPKRISIFPGIRGHSPHSTDTKYTRPLSTRGTASGTHSLGHADTNYSTRRSWMPIRISAELCRCSDPLLQEMSHYATV